MAALGASARLVQLQKYGFWIRTKQTPYRAVRWEVQTHDDGRQKYRGRNWVEVRAHGDTHEPERFYGADVEPAGPHEWLAYYPAADEPLCGWMVEAGKYCPRERAVTDDAIQPFCPKHQAELEESSEGEETHGEDESGAGD